MTYEVYRYIFIGGAILAGIMLVVSILLFFILKISSVIGDLSGSTARKAIENIRNQNENSVNKVYKANQISLVSERLTGKMSRSSKLGRNADGAVTGKTKAYTDQTPVAAQISDTEQTSETTVLSSMEITEQEISAETTALKGPNAETTADLIPLHDNFKVEFELTYVHADELIT